MIILLLEAFMRNLQEKFVVNDQGTKKAVIIPFDKYQQLLEDIHDIAVIAERRDESPISLKELKKRHDSNE